MIEDREEIEEYVGEIVRTLLSDAVDVQATHRAPAELDLLFSGAVNATGGWQGRIEVHCTTPFVTTLGQTMLGQDDVSDEESEDVVGELANIIGGNLKAVFASEQTRSQLSQPSTGRTEQADLGHPDERFYFRAGAGFAIVDIFETATD